MPDVDLVQRTYTAVLSHIIETGRAPHYTDLAEELEIDLNIAREIQRDVATRVAPVGGCWLSHDTDIIESWAPFSSLPTHILISVDGVQKWYGQ